MTRSAIAKATDLLMTDLPIVYREPPDFTLLRERDAIKHIFDSEQRMVRMLGDSQYGWV